MLNIIHQDGSQKFESGTYYVNKEEQSYTIFVIVPDLGEVAVASYDKEEVANAIFAHMVLLEQSLDKAGFTRPVIAVLPKDNMADVKEFLSTQWGFGLWKKIEANKTSVLFDTKNEGE